MRHRGFCRSPANSGLPCLRCAKTGRGRSRTVANLILCLDSCQTLCLFNKQSPSENIRSFDNRLHFVIPLCLLVSLCRSALSSSFTFLDHAKTSRLFVSVSFVFEKTVVLFVFC